MAYDNGGANQPSEAELTTSDLVRQLSEQVGRIVQDEIALARREWEESRQELAHRGKLAGLGAAFGGLAGIMALAAVGAFTAACILLIALALPVWAAALIITGIWLAIAGTLGLTGVQGIRKGASGASEVPRAATAHMREATKLAKEGHHQ